MQALQPLAFLGSLAAVPIALFIECQNVFEVLTIFRTQLPMDLAGRSMQAQNVLPIARVSSRDDMSGESYAVLSQRQDEQIALVYDLVAVSPRSV